MNSEDLSSTQKPVVVSVSDNRKMIPSVDNEGRTGKSSFDIRISSIKRQQKQPELTEKLVKVVDSNSAWLT